MRVWLLLYCNHAESGWYREEIPFALRMFAGVKGFLIYERNSSGTEINLSICWCKK